MAKKKGIWPSRVHYHKAVLAGNNICDTSMKNCHIKASDFSPKFQPGLVATTRPQGWHRMGPGFVRWPCVCDLKCECGRSGIFNVISCGAVNDGCQLCLSTTVNYPAPRSVLIFNGTLSTAVTPSLAHFAQQILHLSAKNVFTAAFQRTEMARRTSSSRPGAWRTPAKMAPIKSCHF